MSRIWYCIIRDIITCTRNADTPPPERQSVADYWVVQGKLLDPPYTAVTFTPRVPHAIRTRTACVTVVIRSAQRCRRRSPSKNRERFGARHLAMEPVADSQSASGNADVEKVKKLHLPFPTGNVTPRNRSRFKKGAGAIERNESCQLGNVLF